MYLPSTVGISSPFVMIAVCFCLRFTQHPNFCGIGGCEPQVHAVQQTAPPAGTVGSAATLSSFLSWFRVVCYVSACSGVLTVPLKSRSVCSFLFTCFFVRLKVAIKHYNSSCATIVMHGQKAKNMIQLMPYDRSEADSVWNSVSSHSLSHQNMKSYHPSICPPIHYLTRSVP